MLLTLGVWGFTAVIESQECLDLYAPPDVSQVVTDIRNFGHDHDTAQDSAEWLNAVANEQAPMWIGEDTVISSTQRATDAVNEIFSRRDF